MANKTHVQFLHSNKAVRKSDGISEPLLPTSGEVYDGEIAVNYKSGFETISFKNSKGEIVTISNDKEKEMRYSLWHHGTGGGAVTTAKGNVASGVYSVAEGGPAGFVLIGKYSYISDSTDPTNPAYRTKDYARLVLESTQGGPAFSAITEAFKNTTLLADTVVSGGTVGVNDEDYNNMSMEVVDVFDNGIYVKGDIQKLVLNGSIYIYKFNGAGTTASGPCSHAEGVATLASGEAAHAEGYATSATGSYAHAEGIGTLASGEGSHAGGSGSSAIANYSTAVGVGVVANNTGQFSCGRWNTTSGGVLFSVGCGTGETDRKDAFRITLTGSDSYYTTTVELNGDITMVELPTNDSASSLLEAVRSATTRTGDTKFSISEIFNAILLNANNNS
jgi:hypothetical protein